ncbi:hypothetical protein GCM10010495_72430 [Kitasatospora herbaricolor]|nr:ABC-type multidrug transport system fused ATPase/permease subunit [Kitasatospora herbaricolor]GGV44495.1 hypothetical protein GCM10010495_72430 [Kitasatospora herbaricolor]
MAGLVRGRTVFVVAHRLSSIRAADRIAVLQVGRLAGIGHDELLGNGGVHQDLHAAAAS